MKEARCKEDGDRWSNRSTPLSRLRHIRQSQGLTQRELARTAKVSSGTIYRLENGLRGAYPTTVQKLAWSLGVPPEQLVHGHHHE